MRKLIKSCRGFTMMELMVGVTVIGIALAAAAPAISSFNASHKVRAATASVESNLRRARSVAITKSSNVRVVCSSVAGAVTVFRDNEGDGVFNTYVSSAVLDRHVNLADVSFGGGNAVVFDSRGRPDNSGQVTIDSEKGGAKMIRLAAGSGAVSVIEAPPEKVEVTQ